MAQSKTEISTSDSAESDAPNAPKATQTPQDSDLALVVEHWLKQPEFKAEIDRQRKQAEAEAFGVLSQGLTKAVENLVNLLGPQDDRLK
ncbi:MAG: hypothetical protein ABSG82_06005 [Sedimentisphaerales bacterium]